MYITNREEAKMTKEQMIQEAEEKWSKANHALLSTTSKAKRAQLATVRDYWKAVIDRLAK
jgi:predicted secreted acid phosphatase